MHELSIALNIVEIVKDETEKHQAESVSELTLEVGSLSGIVKEALEFALEEAVKNSPLENAKIIYEDIRGKAQCEKCKLIFDTDDYFPLCPNCNNLYTDIIEGKELKIKKITID